MITSTAVATQPVVLCGSASTGHAIGRMSATVMKTELTNAENAPSACASPRLMVSADAKRDEEPSAPSIAG